MLSTWNLHGTILEDKYLNRFIFYFGFSSVSSVPWTVVIPTDFYLEFAAD